MRIAPQLKDQGFRALNRVHATLVRVSGGRVGQRAFGMDVVELRTTGRRSGRSHVTMLTTPVVEDDKLVLVASKGGDDRDPDWYKNLLANPDVDVKWRGKLQSMRARVAYDDERATLWPQVVASYHSYDSYRLRTRRVIPLVICSPAPRGASPSTAQGDECDR